MSEAQSFLPTYQGDGVTAELFLNDGGEQKRVASSKQPPHERDVERTPRGSGGGKTHGGCRRGGQTLADLSREG